MVLALILWLTSVPADKPSGLLIETPTFYSAELEAWKVEHKFSQSVYCREDKPRACSLQLKMI